MLRIAERFRPIASVEFALQTRAGRTRRRWLKWLGRLIYLAALGICLTAYLGELIGTLLWRDTSRIHEAVSGVLPFALIVMAVMYLLRVLEALARGANTIAREKETGNWDTLVLTGVDARRIVRGKWWAALRASWPAWLRLLPLRAGVSVFIGAELSRLSSLYIASFAPDQVLIPPNPIGILLVPLVLLVFSFVAEALASALGVFASAAVKRSVAALPVALALHIALVAAIIISAMLIQSALYASYPFSGPDRYAVLIVASSVMATVQLTWLENGTILAAALVPYQLVPAHAVDEASRMLFGPLNEPRRLQLLAYGISLPLVLATYALLTWLALRLAERFAVRAGALPRTSSHRIGSETQQ